MAPESATSNISKPSPLSRLRRFCAANAARVLLPAVGIGIAIGLWYLYSSGHPYTAPSLSTVFSDLSANFAQSKYLADHGVGAGKGYWYDLLYTTRNVVMGVAIGTAIGVVLGFISVSRKLVRDVINPVAATFGSAPIFISAPFFLIWFGVVKTAQIAMVSFYTTLLMYIFALRAAGNVPVEYLESAETLGAQRKHLFRMIYLKATVPELLGAFRIALAGAWGLEAVAELLGAQQGAGFLIAFFVQTYSLPKLIGITLALGVIAVLVDFVVTLLARPLVRWTDPQPAN